MSSVAEPRRDEDARSEPDAGSTAGEAGEDELAALAAMLATPTRPRAVDDEGEELFALDLTDEREVLVALPRQRDEFTCPQCFLVMHVSRQVGDICRDCS